MGNGMAKVRWLLEYDDDFPGPIEILRSGMVEIAELQPGKLWDPRWPQVKPPVVAYGTMRTLRRLQEYKPLAMAVFDNYPALRWSTFVPYVYDMLYRELFLVPLAALEHLDLQRHFGDQVFIRPETNYKLFAAKVIQTTEIAKFIDFHREHQQELIVISEVVELGQEYRCFCRKGRVFCHSSYPQEPYHPAPPQVVAFAEQCAHRLYQTRSLRMLTIDVACSADGTLRLVEIGGVNSWGIYGANRHDFIHAMEAEAREIWNEIDCQQE
jgi:hypothetical protein